MIRKLALALGLACSLPALADQPARVIVKYRADSALLANAPAKRAQALGARVQSDVRTVREMRDRVQLVETSGQTAEALAAKLAAQPDVEYAVPDRIKQIRAVPTDPLFGSQWHLQAAQPAAINATAAWDLSTGSSATVVAVIDTGIRSEHPDLAGKTLPGYDFISVPAVAGDGAGRDADASDPGDYVSAADFQNAPFKGQDCGAGVNVPTSSSWHGTQVSGIIGAATNNGFGVAGVGWNTRILPVRVLGKCGGYDSDIIDGMRWAAGLSVTDVPTNPNPAQVLNLSLGGSGACTAAYRDAIRDITAKGVLVVVAAGNASGSVEEPANCPGVLAVGGLRHAGTKVGYSSFGPEVGIAAPAGNCGDGTGGGCQFPIVTTTNSGATIPAFSTYSNQTNYSIGTSFAAPQVAGVAALLLAAKPGISPADLIAAIKKGARPFPSDASLQTCSAATASSNDGECNCVQGQCGAGMLSAAKALRAAMNLPIALAKPPANPVAGTTLTLDGSLSQPGNTGAITRYTWSLVSAGAGVTAIASPHDAVTTVTATSAGSFSVRLDVADSTGNTDSDELLVTVSEGAPTSRISVSGTPTVNQVVTLDGSQSSATNGRPIASYAWRIVDSGGIVGNLSSTNQPVVTVTPTAAGRFTVALTVTDSAGRSNTRQTTVSVAAASSGTTGDSSGGGGGAVDPFGIAAIALLGVLGYAVRRERSER